jgi:hypothetical protein
VNPTTPVDPNAPTPVTETPVDPGAPDPVPTFDPPPAPSPVPTPVDGTPA